MYFANPVRRPVLTSEAPFSVARSEESWRAHGFRDREMTPHYLWVVVHTMVGVVGIVPVMPYSARHGFSGNVLLVRSNRTVVELMMSGKIAGASSGRKGGQAR